MVQIYGAKLIKKWLAKNDSDSHYIIKSK